MKTILIAILCFVLFLFVYRIFKTYFAVKKVYNDVIDQQKQYKSQQQNHQKSKDNSFDKPKYNIDAETVDFEIIDDKDEK